MRKESEFGVMHVAIYCKPSDWDKIKYKSAPSGKALSKWVCDTVYNYEGEVQPLKKDKSELGKVYPLCIAKDKWLEIKDRAEKAGMKVSAYVMSICLNA